MTNRFYITTPIYYVNSAPHVGTAYTTMVADALARYHALRGERTHFLTGTDEHGLKIEREAQKLGLAPQVFADQMSARFRALWPTLECRPDDFIRTTEARHTERAQRFWERCVAHGDIYLGVYAGLYCVSCEEHKTEKELVEGNLCPIHRRPVERVEEPTYFFRLSAYTDRLLDFYKRHPTFVRPETRLNEVVSFVQQGLRDLSVSRTSFAWGIPVPGDPTHVMYVWFDALLNYLTALEDGENFAALWPPDVQLVGKDILRFHAVYWPALLLSAGFTEAELPRCIFSHGWLMMGEKISKTPAEGDKRRSVGTTDPVRIAEVLGADALRYYLLRDVSFGHDAEFSLQGIISRARSELAETVGNLLNRALPFAKHSEGRVPHAPAEALTDADRALQQRARATAEETAVAWAEYAPHRALEATIELARAGNRYFDESAPWLLAKKGETARLGVVLYHVLEVLRQVAVQLWPAIPAGADALRAQLGLDPLTPRVDADLWPVAWGGLAAHGVLAAGQPVFPKYDKLSEAALLRELGVEDETPKQAPKPAPPKAPVPAAPLPDGVITFDDFTKVDLRLGKVLSAERIPKMDKLLKLSVDVGEPAGPRTIVAGIALAYAPEALVGKQIVVVANLAPKALAGIPSHGMLLACGAPDALSIVTLEKDMAPGTRVK